MGSFRRKFPVVRFEKGAFIVTDTDGNETVLPAIDATVQARMWADAERAAIVWFAMQEK